MHKPRFTRARTTFAFVSAIVLALFSACATAPPAIEVRGDYSPLVEYFTELIPELMEETQVTGLSVALVDSGETIWARGFGYADSAAGVRADEDTVYIIGSITKLFTATAIMQLVERGEVDLDAPVTEYIPELAVKSRFAAAGPIRVRHLLTHHSGLTNDKIAGMWSSDRESFRDIVAYLSTRYVAFPPQYVHSYSNVAFDLLGVIIERVTGRSYSEYVTEELLDPLGMHGSSVSLDQRTRDRYSRTYVDGEPAVELDLRDVPAGDIHSSVAEMTRFMTAAMTDGGGLIAPETFEQMLAPQNLDVARDVGRPMGLTWNITRAGLEYAGRIAWHNGGTMHFMSTMLVLPDHELGVIVLTNSDGGADLVEALADSLLKMALEIKSGIAPPAPSPPHRGPVGDEQRELLRGAFASAVGIIEATPRRRFITAELPGLPRLTLRESEDGWLVPEVRLLGIIPIRSGALSQMRFRAVEIDGVRYLALRQGEHATLIGAELEVPPIPEPWANAVGRYEPINSDGDGWGVVEARAVLQKGVLVAHVVLADGDQFDLILRPIDDRNALVQGIGRGTGITVSLDEEGFEAVGYRFRRIAEE